MASFSRRLFLQGCALAGLRSSLFAGEPAAAAAAGPALIAITLDLEMSRNFPTWETTHWDFEKGNLDTATKEYTVDACQRVQDLGGRIHCFSVARVLEQENVAWLKGLIAEGHPVGNHTYDHVNVLATRPEEVQFRFQRAPWLMRGQKPLEVIRENIHLATSAMESRLGVKPAGFRTPGGFTNGLTGREDVQKLLLSAGFTWVSSQYPAHANTKSGERPQRDVFDSIVSAQQQAQPYVYPTGLIEVPMSPISDIGAFRTGRWPLEDFLQAVKLSVTWAIEQGAVFDFLAHPSCLVNTDPRFQAIELICKLVKDAGDKARLVDLGTIAAQVKAK